jgi:hypothetical protein
MMFPFVIAPGLNTDDTSFAVQAGWIDMDKARFWRGLPQAIGGWESFTAAPVTGVCRAIQPWAGLTGTLNVAFGTHSNLEVYIGGVLSDITPLLALPPVMLGADPFTTTSGQPLVVVSQPGHPYEVGDSNIVSAAAAVGGITPNGTFAVTATTTDTWSFDFTSNATSGATGGGAAVSVAPQRAFAIGAVDGTGGEGFGTGAYSTGEYSQPSAAAFYPRTWAQANYGQSLIANPRGGTIYQWNNDVTVPAAPLLNAPAEVTFALVTPARQVVALGCNEELSGVFDPMNARGSDFENPTDWAETTANNAWEEKFEGGARLVAGAMVGDWLFVWSDTSLWQGQLIGDLGQTYRFTKVGESCGLIGPNALAVVGQSAFWMGPDGNFRACAINGEPQLLLSSAQTDLFDNLAPAQQDKIICSEVPKFGEIWWFYPDARDGNEVSRYLGLSVLGGWWFHGTFDRTAFCKGATDGYPIGVSAVGAAYFHEKGKSADGSPLSGFYESGAQYIGDAEQRILVRGLWPDFQDQVGPLSVTLFFRDYPQGTDRQKGPFTLAPKQPKKSLLGDGRAARVRVSWNSVPAGHRMGKPQFEGDGSGLQ